MITHKAIISKSVEADSAKITGIFFLIRGEEIVYIGNSKLGTGAITKHFDDKEFDRYYFLKCKAEEIQDLSYQYITKFTPIYNKSIPNRDGYVTLPYYKRQLAKAGIEKYTHITLRQLAKHKVGVQVCPYRGFKTYEIDGLNRITNLNIK